MQYALRNEQEDAVTMTFDYAKTIDDSHAVKVILKLNVMNCLEVINNEI